MANLRANNVCGTGGINAIDGSVYFGNHSNSINDYLELADQADLEFGSGDYTVEFWCRPTRDDAVEEIVNKGYPFQVYRSNKQFLLAVDSNTSSYEINTAFGSGEAGEWHHIAVARSGNTTKCFLNGVEGLSSTANTSINDGSSKFSIGRYSDGASYKYQGYVSNLRIVKGTALYTASFTPPTEKLTIVENTVLLCCQDTDDPTQEATGKTITGYGRHNRTGVDLTAGGTVNAPGVLNSTNYPSAASDWSFSNGVATVNSSNSGYDSLGNATGLFENGYEYEFVANITAYSSGKFELGQNGAGNVGINLSAVGRMTFRWKYTGNTTTNNAVAVYAKDHNGNSNFSCNYLSIKKVDMGKEIKVLPPVGVDEGVVFDGDTKVNSQGYMYFPTGDTTQRGRGRAVFAGGDSNGQPYNNAIESYELQTSGMSFDFGDLSLGRNQVRAVASSTRGVFAGGRIPSNRTDVIDYVTIATTSNALDFGNLTGTRGAVAASSNSTRGVFMAGYNPGNLNNIDYITIATTGNATDFGDTLTSTHAHAGFASPTRGIMAGGWPSINVIEYVTIASTGNSTDFGDRVQTQHSVTGCSSQTRGIIGGGDSPNRDKLIDYITIASTGNAVEFGDLVTASVGQKGAASNQILGCFFSGWTGSAYVTDVQKVTIATTGDAVNFGTLMFGRHQIGATSDCHGGLS